MHTTPYAHTTIRKYQRIHTPSHQHGPIRSRLLASAPYRSSTYTHQRIRAAAHSYITHTPAHACMHASAHQHICSTFLWHHASPRGVRCALHTACARLCSYSCMQYQHMCSSNWSHHSVHTHDSWVLCCIATRQCAPVAPSAERMLSMRHTPAHASTHTVPCVLCAYITPVVLRSCCCTCGVV